MWRNVHPKQAAGTLAAVFGAAILLAVLVSAGGMSSVQAAGDDTAEATKLQFYKSSAEPILRANCYRCHAALNRRGGLQMDTRAGLLQGGHDGAAIVPGHPEESLLIKLIRHEGPKDDPMPMPPNRKLSDADIATVTRWVSEGALMDR